MSLYCLSYELLYSSSHHHCLISYSHQRSCGLLQVILKLISWMPNFCLQTITCLSYELLYSSSHHHCLISYSHQRSCGLLQVILKLISWMPNFCLQTITCVLEPFSKWIWAFLPSSVSFLHCSNCSNAWKPLLYSHICNSKY